MNQIFKTKSLEHVMAESEGGERLKRVLGPWSLTALGIGAIIGTGIFVLVGQAARDITGPALMLSFVVAGLACIFAALCYAEFASMAPVAGSAYTYAYLTLGELMAWVIGWDLVLEYAVASCTVAHGWSKYLGKLLAMMGMAVPGVVHEAPFSLHPNTGEVIVGHVEKLKDLEGNDIKVKEKDASGQEREIYDLKKVDGKEVVTRTYLDLPAALIALAITAILVKGIKESAGFNALMVAIKVSVVLLVIGVGAFYVDPKNWENFAPYGFGGLSFFGHVVWGELRPNGLPRGMLAGAAMIFFFYFGFDAVSTN
ncbi:MAG: amino acid permease, partial [Planctomycetota bacterium]